MPVLDFPSPTLTQDDEAAILERLRRDGHYSCRRDEASGSASLTLFNSARQERGRITKRHGVYVVRDPRGHAILRTRRLDEVLAVLGK